MQQTFVRISQRDQNIRATNLNYSVSRLQHVKVDATLAKRWRITVFRDPAALKRATLGGLSFV